MRDAPRPARKSSRRRYEEWRDGPREQPGANAAEPKAKRSARGRGLGALVRAFWKLLRGHRRTLGAALCTLSLATGLGLLPPYATKLVFDHVLVPDPPPRGALLERAPQDPMALLVVICMVVFASTALGALLAIWGRWQCTRLVKQVQVRLRRRTFEHAARLPLNRVQEMKSGGVSSLLREDAGGVADLIFSLVYNPWRAVTQLTGTLVILAVIDWRMLVGAAALLPIVWLSHRTWIGRIRPMYRSIRLTRQRIDGQSTEAFAGMRIVRGFNRERSENARFTSAGHLMARQEIRAWWWSRSLEIVWQLLVPVATIAVLLYFGRGVLRGERTPGELIAFLLYLGWLLGPLESLVSSATSVQNQLAGLDRVIDLLDEPEEFADHAAGAREIGDGPGRLTLDRVSFAYPARRRAENDGEGEDASKLGKPVLRGIDLDVEPGETIALVGPSGSGKTTLCNLVARFYDPTAGRVLLDGIDLRETDPRSYRRQLGIVEQDVFLFDGSVADNIAYARRHATPVQIEAAARAANAHGFITELEDGYATIIGERGVRLSGGQKQRLAIARAVLADPRILILDEATSNLDSESEALIQRSLESLMRGRTTFVIAHRLSTIRHADRIVVLEQGRVREIGSHDELMARDGRYAELVRLQTQREEGDDELAEPSVVA